LLRSIASDVVASRGAEAHRRRTDADRVSCGSHAVERGLFWQNYDKLGHGHDMARIFISYRRADSEIATGRIYDRLEAHFGRGTVFMDVDDIPLGVDFREHLDQQIRGCDALIAVIGKRWLTIRDRRRKRRLDAPQDYVRTEIEIALDRGIPVIPVLLQGVTMPAEADLPPSIAKLAYRNAAQIDPGAGFRMHMDRLIRGLGQLLTASTDAPEPDPTDEPAQIKAPSKPAASPAPAVATEPRKTEPRTEAGRLIAELRDPGTHPKRRLAIGDRLAEIGDPRPGVGLDADGLPDIDWVEVPAGEFLFGEKNATAFVDAFRIARYPITNAQYAAFIDAGGYRDDRWWRGLAKRIEAPAESSWPHPNRPRTHVTWYEAIGFCRWLSEQLRLDIRLPTEIEWEKAARGPDGRAFPWGGGHRAGVANINETVGEAGLTYLKQTTAVGMYPIGASPYGLLDAAGNVWEWCLNKFEKRQDIETDGNEGRVVRGGSWFDFPGRARSAVRGWNHPDARYDFIGFRVLCSSPICGQ
jgi:hypothetical protein